MKLILASASPRRRELLAQMGEAFDVVPAGLDEVPWPNEAPASYALRNAFEKAGHVLARLPRQEDGLLISADTIVVLAGRILEKPADAAHAAAMLRDLSGCTHEVITGLCVARRAGGRERWLGDAVRTAVTFRALSEPEIAAYVASGEPMDKAGAYAIQGGAAGMVLAVQGSYTNVVGLPVDELRAMLKQARET